MELLEEIDDDTVSADMQEVLLRLALFLLAEQRLDGLGGLLAKVHFTLVEFTHL